MIPAKPQNCLPILPNITMTPLHTKNNYIKITLKKYTYKSENTPITPFHTKNNHVKKHSHKSKTYSYNNFSH